MTKQDAGDKLHERLTVIVNTYEIPPNLREAIYNALEAYEADTYSRELPTREYRPQIELFAEMERQP